MAHNCLISLSLTINKFRAKPWVILSVVYITFQKKCAKSHSFQIYTTRAFANPIIRYNNTIQERAFMDEATFLDWTNAAWHSFSLNSQPTWTTMDSCAVHGSLSIKEALRKLGYRVHASLWIQLSDPCVDNIVALNQVWPLFENLKLWIAKTGSVFKIGEEILRQKTSHIYWVSISV